MTEQLKTILPVIRQVSFDQADRIRKIDEVVRMLNNVQNATFTTRGIAKKLTGLTYLAGVNSNSKTVKGNKLNYDTLILYLAASDMSGYNLCPMATEGCKKACLVSSGRARIVSTKEKINAVTWARLKKTWLFYANRKFFNAWLFAEIAAAKQLAKKRNKNFAVRLNGTSDLPLQMFSVDGKSVLETFPEIQFYDYTKTLKQMRNGVAYDNYDVTFSYAGTDEHNNKQNAYNALAMGLKISVVFDTSTFPNKKLPDTFLGYDVADGDETDLTFLQKEQVLGLTFKKTGHNPKGNKFVIAHQNK